MEKIIVHDKIKRWRYRVRYNMKRNRDINWHSNSCDYYDVLCSVFTFSDAVSEKALTTCIPESVSITEDGKTQYDFNLQSYGQDIGSIVFYSSHQRINVYAQGEEIYRLSNKRSIWGNTPDGHGIL